MAAGTIFLTVTIWGANYYKADRLSSAVLGGLSISPKEGNLGGLPRSTSKEGFVSPRLIPTGECWCGCGKETGVGSFFLAGHDKVAESAVVMVEYGGVPEFMERHGYGLGRDHKNSRQTLEAWRKGGGRPR